MEVNSAHLKVYDALLQIKNPATSGALLISARMTIRTPKLFLAIFFIIFRLVVIFFRINYLIISLMFQVASFLFSLVFWKRFIMFYGRNLVIVIIFDIFYLEV